MKGGGERERGKEGERQGEGLFLFSYFLFPFFSYFFIRFTSYFLLDKEDLVYRTHWAMVNRCLRPHAQAV